VERGEPADTVQIRCAIQRDVNQLEKRANRNQRKLNEGKCEVLHLGRKHPWLGTDCLESSCVDMGSWCTPSWT